MFEINDGTVGWIALNLAFLLDSLYYFPQVFKNHSRHDDLDISISMHFIILIGCISDLLYSFGRHMPWQYQATTVTCLLPVLIQYYQLWCVNDNPRVFALSNKLLASWVIALSTAYLMVSDVTLIALFNGYMTQLCFSIALIPQILKNYRLGHADALSLPTFIMMFIISCCDITSAWSLEFDLPSRYGSIMIIILESTCIAQIAWYRYKYSQTVQSLEWA
ncbi:MAG: hypothetical protein CMF46_02535 [Legionellales bacterium]|nr:hypothetical protein [Legionellales bacterium]|tara:strand:- start:305 stop:964 length:660 start_codon:yes stop_codon:yes gene_type:complete